MAVVAVIVAIMVIIVVLVVLAALLVKHVALPSVATQILETLFIVL